MQHLQIAKIVVSWIKNYIVNYLLYMLIYVTYTLTDKTYNFEYKDETYKIKLNRQSLRTLLYVYQENLEVCELEKLDEDYMAAYRLKFLKKYGANNLLLDTNQGNIEITKDDL